MFVHDDIFTLSYSWTILTLYFIIHTIITERCVSYYYAEVTLKPTTVTTATESPSVTLSVDPENSCFFAALIAGGAGALGSAILVLCVSVTIHVAVYRCVYKPRLRRSRAVLANAIDDLNKKADRSNIGTVAAEHEYAFIYEVVGERASTAGMEIEMKHNEIYGLVEPSES